MGEFAHVCLCAYVRACACMSISSNSVDTRKCVCDCACLPVCMCVCTVSISLPVRVRVGAKPIDNKPSHRVLPPGRWRLKLKVCRLFHANMCKFGGEIVI